MRFQSFSQLLQIDSDLSFGPPSSTFFRVGERSNRGPSTVAILLYREVENHCTFRSSYTLEKVKVAHFLWRIVVSHGRPREGAKRAPVYGPEGPSARYDDASSEARRRLLCEQNH